MTTQPSHYEFVVRGHLDDRWAEWLGDLTITRNEDGTSTLIAPIADQSQLHGVLAELRDMATTLLSVRAVTAPSLAPQTTWDATAEPPLDKPVHTARLTLRPGPPRTTPPGSTDGSSL
jgi:hypothetical protein